MSKSEKYIGEALLVKNPSKSIGFQIKEGAVGTEKLADSSVTTEKLADGAVTREKLNEECVNPARILEEDIDKLV